MIVADTFFGSHKLAGALASRQKAFLCLVKRDQLGVQEAGGVLGEGESCVTTNVEEAPRVVPIVNKLQRRGGAYPIPHREASA